MLLRTKEGSHRPCGARGPTMWFTSTTLQVDESPVPRKRICDCWVTAGAINTCWVQSVVRSLSYIICDASSAVIASALLSMHSVWGRVRTSSTHMRLYVRVGIVLRAFRTRYSSK